MINNRQTGRRRGRGGPRPQGMEGRPNGGGGGNRPEPRSRGNAPQLYEKYKAMARDAQMSGDRVQTEYYLQFADHYFRILNENRPRYEDQRPQRNDGPADEYEDEDGEMSADDEQGGSYVSDEAPARQQQQQGNNRQQRDDRSQRDDRPQANDRAQGNDRPQGNDRQQREDRPQRYAGDRPNGSDRDARPDRDDRPQRAPFRDNGQARDQQSRDQQPRDQQQRDQQQRDQQPRDQTNGQDRSPRGRPPLAQAAERPDADARPDGGIQSETPSYVEARDTGDTGSDNVRTSEARAVEERPRAARTPRTRTPRPVVNEADSGAGIDFDRLPPAIARSVPVVEAADQSAGSEGPRPVRRTRRARADASASEVQSTDASSAD